MHIQSSRGRARSDGLRQVLQRKSRARLVAGERHQLGPFRSVGTTAAAVKQMGRDVGDLVANHLAKKLDGAGEQPPVQTDQTVGRVAATQRSTKTGAELDLDEFGQLWDVPEQGPLIDPGLIGLRHREERV